MSTEWGILVDRGDGTSHVQSTGEGPEGEKAALGSGSPVAWRRDRESPWLDGEDVTE